MHRRISIVPLFLGVMSLAGPLPAQLSLVESGGSLVSEKDLALGGTAFAIDAFVDLDPIGLASHTIPHLNDGVYGNANSWIGLTGAPGFVGIAFADPTAVSSFAFGRDNTGTFGDRCTGTYTLQYTQVPAPDKSTPDGDWTTIGDVSYDCSFTAGSMSIRHRYNFPAVTATAIRLLVPETGIGAPNSTCIDELEVYADPGAAIVPPLVPRLALVSTGGPLTTPSAADAVPTLAQGNLARDAAAVAFATPPYDNPAHTIPHLNDGMYGNGNSWLGEFPGPDSGKFYAGIYFTDGEKKIAQVALGRDNTAGFPLDRADGPHTVQYTQDEFDNTSDAATDGAAWITLGLAAEHCRSGDLWPRRVYSFPPVMARAIRVLTAYGNVIDELEVGLQIGTPPPPELRLLGAPGGPVTTPAAAGDVPTVEAGNLARAADAVAFATPPLIHECHTIPHLNDGLYGNCQSWLGNEAGAVSGKVYCGIYFNDGTRVINEIALGRDNTGVLGDRADGVYLVQYTTDEFDPASDAAADVVAWSTIGEARAHLTDGQGRLRHVYCLEGILARAVRVIVTLGSVIDELELLGLTPTGSLVLAEEGGAFAPDNLATAEGATAFALDALIDIDPADEVLSRHTIPHLNDGVYGNLNSWIGRTGDLGFAGIAFGGSKTVSSVAFGRDNLGETFDRFSGTYAIQYTTVDAPGASTSACDWITIASVSHDGWCPPRAWLRHRYNFAPVTATAIRLLVPETGLQANGTCIDELEVYADPGEVTAPTCIRPEPLALLETGGPVTTPAGAGDVPTYWQGNFARAPNAVPFGTPPYPDPAHTIPHLNDGLYGNGQSWLGNEAGATSGRVYAGIYFDDGTRRIHGIALGRDNTGGFTDRAAGEYMAEYTADEFDPADDAAIDAAAWTPIGLAGAHLTDGTPGLRHRYGFDAVDVRAVRVRTVLWNAIDEIELLGDPPSNTQPHAVMVTRPDPPAVTLAGGSAQVELDGSGSDDGDGGLQGLTFAWEKVSGPEGDAIAAPASAVTAVTFTASGSYVYRLTVSDGQAENGTATAEVTVTVSGGDQFGFRRGDADGSGELDLTDAIFTLEFQFMGGDAPTCKDAADADDSGELDLTDAIYSLQFQFMGGTAPPAPGPYDCGPDPSSDTLPDCAYPVEECP